MLSLSSILFRHFVFRLVSYNIVVYSYGSYPSLVDIKTATSRTAGWHLLISIAASTRHMAFEGFVLLHSSPPRTAALVAIASIKKIVKVVAATA